MEFNKDFELYENNFIKNKTKKNKIILCNSFYDLKKLFKSWSLKNMGYYKKTPAFSIDAGGLIYNHFNPNYYSNYFNDVDLNLSSIVILIENLGYLKPINNNNEYITWYNDIYNKDLNNIFKKKWRNEEFWDNYTENQLISSIKLTKYLLTEFNIDKQVIGHNTKIDNYHNYNGVLYKSNINKKYLDLNPNWFYDEFKRKIEI